LEAANILIESNITIEQIVTTIVAVPAFVPVTVCTGYLAAWLTNLHGFRQRTIVERLFWSVPLSVAISTIGLVLAGRFASLGVAAALTVLSVIGCIVVVGLEWSQLRRSGSRWNWGIRPLGGTILFLSAIWIVFVVLTLVDFQSQQRLFMSLTFWDIGARVNWANSVLRTGVPPANPHYFYLHPANLRYYYFWLVDCAVVAKISGLPMRSIVGAGCIWSGFCLEALTGLYLKHFLVVGARLRRQFLLAALLPAVGGFALCIYIGNMIVMHIPPPGDVWYAGQIADLINFFLFYPHHLVSMVCCMFALLLAWMWPAANRRDRIASVIFIAAALASSFGLSIYVAFAFFLIMMCWAAWQVFFKYGWRAPAALFAGGVIASVLLAPYLYELTHSASKMASENGVGGGGGSPFSWSVRETIPPDRLAHSAMFRGLAEAHPAGARALAKLVLMPPGLVLELGVYFFALIIFLVPAWRGRRSLTPAQQTLVFITIATLPFAGFIRSSVINVNDFGIHSALFMQYPLLLLLSELLIAWKLEKDGQTAPELTAGLPGPAPYLLRSLVTLGILIGVLGTTWRVLVLRFILPISQVAASQASNPQVAELAHKAYIAYFGYKDLDARIPKNAIVQFNPVGSWLFWRNVDLVNTDHQVATVGSGLWCGAELGGDPSGCPAMLKAIDPLFQDAGATAEQARAACKTYRVDYLVATIYDPQWKDLKSWVWTLPTVLADPEFRAVDCR
jgi:hypothetical protein